jgi:hypothetical protein
VQPKDQTDFLAVLKRLELPASPCESPLSGLKVFSPNKSRNAKRYVILTRTRRISQKARTSYFSLRSTFYFGFSDDYKILCK